MMGLFAAFCEIIRLDLDGFVYFDYSNGKIPSLERAGY
jgi:hypothetical protein